LSFLLLLFIFIHYDFVCINLSSIFKPYNKEFLCFSCFFLIINLPDMFLLSKSSVDELYTILLGGTYYHTFALFFWLLTPHHRINTSLVLKNHLLPLQFKFLQSLTLFFFSSLLFQNSTSWKTVSNILKLKVFWNSFHNFLNLWISWIKGNKVWHKHLNKNVLP
jgi:hypothetical protein